MALAVLLLASLVLAQDRPDSIETGQGVVASVNGEAITSTDVIFQARVSAGTAAAQVDDEMAHSVRREIAQQVLLASEAERLGVQLTPAYIEDFWTRYHGQRPEYEAMAAAAGSTVERQKELVKRSVMADLFLYHRVGIWQEFAHLLRPDPVLTHFVEITPKELRELFVNEREAFDIPATVTYEFYPCADEAEAEGVRESLALHLTPNVPSAKESPPVSALPELFAFSPPLLEFLQTAEPDSTSQAFDAQAGWVVFRVIERDPGRAAEFREVQEDIKRRLRFMRIDGARRKLLADLTREAVYWPKDLFELELVPEQGLSGAGAAETLRKTPAPAADQPASGSP